MLGNKDEQQSKGNVSRKIKAYCKTSGIRCPEKKLIVADHLQLVKGYTDVATLYLTLRNSCVKISQATVYVSLGWLVCNGFAECKTPNQTTRKENVYRIRREEL